MAWGCVNHHTGFLFPVVDVKSFCHDEKNVNVIRRELICSIVVIHQARVTMLRYGSLIDGVR
jgi:hypothetical protein